MNPFLERYKHHSNAALLKILAAPANYQRLALEAAQEVLDARNLSEEELAAAHAELEAENAVAAVKTAKEQELKNKAQEIGNRVLNEVNPFHVNSPTVKRIIIITTLIFTWFALQGVYTMYSNRYILMFGIDESVIIALFPLFLVPLLQITGTVLFAFRKKSGWVILAVYAVMSAAAWIFFSVKNIIDIVNPPEPSMFDSSFEQTGLSESVVGLVIYSGLLVIMNRTDVREVYRVKRRTFIIILVIVGAFSLGILNAFMR